MGSFSYLKPEVIDYTYQFDGTNIRMINHRLLDNNDNFIEKARYFASSNMGMLASAKEEKNKKWNIFYNIYVLAYKHLKTLIIIIKHGRKFGDMKRINVVLTERAHKSLLLKKEEMQALKRKNLILDEVVSAIFEDLYSGGKS